MKKDSEVEKPIEEPDNKRKETVTHEEQTIAEPQGKEERIGKHEQKVLDVLNRDSGEPIP